MQNLSDHKYIAQLFLKIPGADWAVLCAALLGPILGGLLAEARVNTGEAFLSQSQF
jgi:hypothetical protein